MTKQIKVREDNYFAVQGWMVTELKLKGNALMLYAIIYGFSQTTNTAFTGSVDYLCEWLGGVSRPTVINTLDNLVKQGLLTKSSTTKGALIYNSYTALRPSKKILSDEDPTSKKTLPDTSKNFLLNKDSKDNIEKSISKEMEGKAPKDTGVEELRYRCANGGDSRTCQYCRADNDKVFKRGEEPTLPRHPNCRCVYIPVVSDTFEDNELNELTGSVRGAENYEKWREAEAKKQEEVKPVEKVNTKTVEKELKENPTPVPEQIKLTDYPQAFYATKPEAKNTQALLDYMNSKTSTDPNVVALYTKMDKLCDGLSDEVVLKVTHGEHRVKRSWNKNFDYVVDVGIPKINPNYIGTYDTNLHEEMHFLDMLITVKDNKDKLPSNMFSQSYKPLVEAFDKATPVIGDKAKKLFEDFAKECDIIYKEKQEAFDIQHEKIKEQYRSGAIDWKKYNSLFKTLQKEVNEEADNKRRALFGGGVSGLQDIYDAVSKGTFRDTGQVTYGHGSAYYTDRRRTNPNCSESLANYASLCVGHPELIDILAEDYPEIVTALRGCVEAMLKEVPK